MRLRTLLLSSAGALLAAAAANSPAQAADPVSGLVVTSGASMNYVPACNGDDGVLLEDWCLYFDWSDFAWSTSFGYEFDYGNLPGGNTIVPVGTGPWGWDGFTGSGASPTLYLSRETDAGWMIEFRTSAFSDPRLRLTTPGGVRFEFTDDGFGVRFSTAIGPLEVVTSQGGGGLPEFHMTFAPSFGPVDLRFALLVDPSPYAITYAGADATFDAGPAAIKVGAWWNGTGWGAGGQVTLDDIGGGPFGLVFGGNWSMDAPTPSSSCSDLYSSCGYGAIPAYERYHYPASAGTYWAAFTQATYDSSLGTTRLRISVNDGPLSQDRTLDTALRQTVDIGDTPVDLYVEGVMARAWYNGAMANAFSLKVGIAGPLP